MGLRNSALRSRTSLSTTRHLQLDEQGIDRLLDEKKKQFAVDLERIIRPNLVGLEDFILYGEIDKGRIGTVIFVRHIANDTNYALKRIEKRGFRADRALREKTILFAADFPFIVLLYETFKDNRYVYFVLELALCGCLRDHTRMAGLDEEVVRFWMAQVVLAVEYLHSANVIHRDLKLENVLLNPNGYVMLTDFDAARCLPSNGKATSLRGTPFLLAPEMVFRLPYGKAVDWWTVGLMVHELFYLKLPYEEKQLDARTFENMRAELESLYLSMGPGFAKSSFSKTMTARISRQLTEQSSLQSELAVSEAAIDFMYSTLRTDPMFRLGGHLSTGSDEVRKHGFFDALNWKALYEKRFPWPGKNSPPPESVRPMQANVNFQPAETVLFEKEYEAF